MIKTNNKNQRRFNLPSLPFENADDEATLVKLLSVGTREKFVLDFGFQIFEWIACEFGKFRLVPCGRNTYLHEVSTSRERSLKQCPSDMTLLAFIR